MKYFPGTLWHGTSAHLLPSIKEHGLGGRNVLEELRIMDFMQEAFPYLGYEDYDFSNPDYLDLLPVRSAVRGGARGLNFEYGDVYATGGFDKAATYARTAPELVSLAKTIVDIGRRDGIDAIESALIDFPEAKGLLELPYAPIVLKLPRIPLDRVEDERGGSPILLTQFDEKVRQEVMGQVAFRVKGLVPFDELEVFEVDQDTGNEVKQ